MPHHLDSEQQRLMTLLATRGPMTEQQLADLVYPDGSGFPEDRDLSAAGKVRMDLRLCGFGAEVVGQVPDEYGDPVDLWAATTPERAEELRRAARLARAAWILRVRAADRGEGERDVFELLEWRAREERRRAQREWSRLTPREQIERFNAEHREQSVRMAAVLEELKAKVAALRAAEAP